MPRIAFMRLSFTLAVIGGMLCKYIFLDWLWDKLNKLSKKSEEKRWPLYVAIAAFFFDTICFIFILTQII